MSARQRRAAVRRTARAIRRSCPIGARCNVSYDEMNEWYERSGAIVVRPGRIVSHWPHAMPRLVEVQFLDPTSDDEIAGVFVRPHALGRVEA